MSLSETIARLTLYHATIVTLLAVLVSPPEVALASDGTAITITGDQRVTAVAEGTSIRALLEEISRRAGVSLRYADLDGPFTIMATNVPLIEVYRTLLHDRSFVLNVRPDPEDGTPRVVSVDVFAANPPSAIPTPEAISSVSSGRLEQPATGAGWLLSHDVLEATFGNGDEVQRRQALTGLEEDFRADPSRLQALLAADTSTIATALRRFPNAVVILGRFAASPAVDPIVKAKLEAVIAILAEP